MGSRGPESGALLCSRDLDSGPVPSGFSSGAAGHPSETALFATPGLPAARPSAPSGREDHAAGDAAAAVARRVGRQVVPRRRRRMLRFVDTQTALRGGARAAMCRNAGRGGSGRRETAGVRDPRCTPFSAPACRSRSQGRKETQRKTGQSQPGPARNRPPSAAQNFTGNGPWGLRNAETGRSRRPQEPSHGRTLRTLDAGAPAAMGCRSGAAAVPADDTERIGGRAFGGRVGQGVEGGRGGSRARRTQNPTRGRGGVQPASSRCWGRA